VVVSVSQAIRASGSLDRKQVDDRIGNLVGNLVGMPFGHAFGREEIIAAHWYRLTLWDDRPPDKAQADIRI